MKDLVVIGLVDAGVPKSMLYLNSFVLSRNGVDIDIIQF